MVRCEQALVAILALVGVASCPTASQAFSFSSEVCLDEVVVRGQEVSGERAARSSAIAGWRKAAARRYGRNFADYNYSGEREFQCTWNDSGTRYRCTVSARPCGQKSGKNR